MNKAKRLFEFMDETIDYFSLKIKNVSRDLYFADRDTRNILDKTINDIILCMVDIAEECLKRHTRAIPDTYRDTILACHEFMGDITLQIAPLIKHRNEMIHQYLKANWQNIITVNKRIPEIKQFIEAAKKCLINNE